MFKNHTPKLFLLMMILLCLTFSTSCVSSTEPMFSTAPLFPASLVQRETGGLSLRFDADGSHLPVTRVQAVSILQYLKDLKVWKIQALGR